MIIMRVYTLDGDGPFYVVVVQVGFFLYRDPLDYDFVETYVCRYHDSAGFPPCKLP
jgi:hypothetical protein